MTPKAYPTDLTDAEWNRLQPWIPPPKPGADPAPLRYGKCSTPFSMSCEAASPGGCSPTNFRPGKRSTTTSAAGKKRVCGNG